MAIDFLRKLAIRLRIRHQVRKNLFFAQRLCSRFTVKFKTSGKLRSELKSEFDDITTDFELNMIEEVDKRAVRLRAILRKLAGLENTDLANVTEKDVEIELSFLMVHAKILKPYFKKLVARRVLYPGHCYYNSFYLSRGLRKKGWRADVKLGHNPDSQKFYHGEDFVSKTNSPII